MAMGRPKKDPALVRSVPLRLPRDAAGQGRDRRDGGAARGGDGDDSLTGWFLALVHREAKRADIAIQTASEAKPAPAKRGAAASKAAPRRVKR